MTENMMDREVNRKVTGLFLNVTSMIFIFILYTSLLPYNVTGNLGDVSFASFVDTLRISAISAQQGTWIAHAIFNLLLTFVASIYCQQTSKKIMWIFMYGAIIIFGVLIEYFQMFIGSRGTSLVDIYANIAGMGFGFIAWALFGKFTVRVVKDFIQHGTLSIGSVKKIYLAFVIAIILFPFDFFINMLQLQIAFASKGMPLFENNSAQGIGTISLVAAMLLLFPLGVIYKMVPTRRKSRDISLVFKFTFLLLFLEILQFFEISGQSSFPSYFAKLIGFCAGLYIGRFLSLKFLLDTLLRMRLLILLVTPVFLWVAFKIKGGVFTFSSSLDDIMAVIGNTSFLPFKYYINVGSGEALLSFLLNFVIFIPIGGVVAVYYISKEIEQRRSFSSLVRLGLLCAILLELAVLVWGLERPDITNIIVSGFALPLGYYFVLMAQNAVNMKSVD